MILSFHPCYTGDKNLLCAGREPNETDINLIKKASAVILPQGCKESLYEVTKKNCQNMFPNYDARFEYKEKIGQSILFQKINVSYPKTKCFDSVLDFINFYEKGHLKFNLPFVFKFNWGGEGDNVFLIESEQNIKDIIEKAILYEKTGQQGFLMQEYIPSKNKSLRVVVIYKYFKSYWRVQKNFDKFKTNLKDGAEIDYESNKELQEQGIELVKEFCNESKINLAGFDLIFSSNSLQPFFIEINYFFGRNGFGGSRNYYKILIKEINRWIHSVISK
ncbi:MAG: hypothetical protein HQK76_04800 [Desulfobacterales bacterium]|nr:hypothetical protein [Desulfobacterales bacterium]